VRLTAEEVRLMALLDDAIMTRAQYDNEAEEAAKKEKPHVRKMSS